MYLKKETLTTESKLGWSEGKAQASLSLSNLFQGNRRAKVEFLRNSTRIRELQEFCTQITFHPILTLSGNTVEIQLRDKRVRLASDTEECKTIFFKKYCLYWRGQGARRESGGSQRRGDAKRWQSLFSCEYTSMARGSCVQAFYSSTDMMQMPQKKICPGWVFPQLSTHFWSHVSGF